MEDVKIALVKNCSFAVYSSINCSLNYSFLKWIYLAYQVHTKISTIIISSYNNKISRFFYVIKAIRTNFSFYKTL